MFKKGLFAVILAIAVMFASVVDVFAMSETELMNKFKTPIDVNGTELKIPQYYLNLAEDYFDQFKVSEKDCQYVADEMDKLIKLAKQDGITTWDEFAKKHPEEIRQACANVSANTGIKATVLSNGKVSISKYNKPNEVFAIINVNILKNTGSAKVIYIAGILALIGAGLLVFQVRKAKYSL